MTITNISKKKYLFDTPGILLVFILVLKKKLFIWVLNTTTVKENKDHKKCTLLCIGPFI